MTGAAYITCYSLSYHTCGNEFQDKTHFHPFMLHSASIPLSGSMESHLKSETDSLYGHKVIVAPIETHSCLQLDRI